MFLELSFPEQMIDFRPSTLKSCSRLNSLKVIEKINGKKKMRKFLKRSLDTYLTQRTFESKRLFNIVFRETALLSLFTKKNSLAQANVWLGKQSLIDLIAQKQFKKIVSPVEFNKTKIKLKWMDPVAAPISKGDTIGEIFINIHFIYPLFI